MRNRTHRRPLLDRRDDGLARGHRSGRARDADRRRRLSTTVPAEPERVKVVRVQVDEGLDWGDAGIGAPGCSHSSSSASVARTC